VPSNVTESPISSEILPSITTNNEPRSDSPSGPRISALTGMRLSSMFFNAGYNSVDDGIFILTYAHDGLAEALYWAWLGKYKCLRGLVAILAYEQGLLDIEAEAEKRLTELLAASGKQGQSLVRAFRG
jgi:hypothetical protein